MKSTRSRGKNNLRLKIRSDEIEITREKFRYNADLLKANEVNGVRFGIYIHAVNGIRSAYYTVGACDLHGHQINIDCKRVFRSEAEADADWRAIVNALYRQIVPGLCTRLVQRILSGTDLSIGEARLCSQGMCIPTGMLFWKETPLSPYPEIWLFHPSGYAPCCFDEEPQNFKSICASRGLERSHSGRPRQSDLSCSRQMTHEPVTAQPPKHCMKRHQKLKKQQQLRAEFQIPPAQPADLATMDKLLTDIRQMWAHQQGATPVIPSKPIEVVPASFIKGAARHCHECVESQGQND